MVAIPSCLRGSLLPGQLGKLVVEDQAFARFAGRNTVVLHIEGEPSKHLCSLLLVPHDKCTAIALRPEALIRVAHLLQGRTSGILHRGHGRGGRG